MARTAESRGHMVFFALTRSGLDELMAEIGRTPSPLWVNDGVLSANEMKGLREAGIDLTNFTRPIALEDQSAVITALETIGEHHPGEVIWIEYPPISNST